MGMTRAIYPGTFDPITNGHVDLVERGARLFDQVIVAIAADHTKKSPLFPLSERVALAAEALRGIKNAEVCDFSGLLIDFARERGARVLLRGLRAVADFEYEFQLASMNRHMQPEIETVFLMPAEQYTYISASMVREISLLGGDVASFVPAPVARALRRRHESEGRR